MMQDSDFQAAQTIWEYMQLHQQPRYSEVTIAMGVTNLGVAWRCAELWQQKLTAHFIFSGYAAPGMKITEAELLANEAMKHGVPPEVITLEPKASDSAKNLLYSYEIMKQRDLSTDTVTIVSKPYMERRASAIAGAQWPDKHTSFYFTSYKEGFDTFLERSGVKHSIRVMLGDFDRIREYPKRGWQTPQTIPAEVTQAAEHLKANGWAVRAVKP